MKRYLSLFSVVMLIFILVSCQPNGTFEWNAGISAPKNYPSGAPFVEYFYKGKGIAGASTGTGADQGWGVTSGGYVGGNEFKEVPDSVFVKWVCSVDNLVYKGGFKLPRDKMLELFKKGAIDSYGDHREYGVITAGMAPGGNVTIWMQGGNASTEIEKFKIKGEEDPNIDEDYKKKEIKSWGNYLTYWKIHGIPYSVWEKGEKEYNYDIGFSSENNNVEPNITTFYAKDGSWHQPYCSSEALISIDKENWNKFQYVANNNKIKRAKLPVQMELEWKFNHKYYSTNVILPNNFESYFSKYNYDRIVIGVDKNSLFGIIWVERKKGRDKVMSFKIFEAEKNEDGSYIPGGYSLPKGFLFPKWQGREPLKFPEIEYWQEK